MNSSNNQPTHDYTRAGTSDSIGQAQGDVGHESGGKPDGPLPSLPEIQPTSDLGLDLTDMFGSGNPDVEKVQKRASNVQKLAQENEKLKAELKAMSDRLEAAEKRREELSQKKQMIREPPTD
ncbi:hypothetical protein PQX77_003886 [Marasmius sp. AFHP31]|nr:hypothetical protein PQX77_003886 [Marasmius sp. AFHP31]